MVAQFVQLSKMRNLNRVLFNFLYDVITVGAQMTSFLLPPKSLLSFSIMNTVYFAAFSTLPSYQFHSLKEPLQF